MTAQLAREKGMAFLPTGRADAATANRGRMSADFHLIDAAVIDGEDLMRLNVKVSSVFVCSQRE
jgi:hypothetical protein